MRFRLDDPALERLYATGTDRELASETILGFFGLLETVNAARDIHDLRALVSVDLREDDNGVLTMLVDGNFRLSATIEEGADESVLRIDRMTVGAPGHG
jgi:plasmid maintenance system killer protein